MAPVSRSYKWEGLFGSPGWKTGQARDVDARRPSTYLHLDNMTSMVVAVIILLWV